MKILVIALLFPLSTWADSFLGRVYTSDLGRGVLSSTELGGLCTEGIQKESRGEVKIVYRLGIEPVRNGIFGDADPSRVYVAARMFIADRDLSMTEVKVRKGFADFERACGSQYLAKVSLGATISRRVKIRAEEASKITPYEVVATSDADLITFQETFIAEMAKIESFEGIGGDAIGFKRGYKSEDFNRSINNLFTIYLNEWHEEKFDRMAIEGWTEAYPNQ